MTHRIKADHPLMHELRERLARLSRLPQDRLPLPNIRTTCSNTPTSPCGQVVDPAFAIVAQGAKRAVLGDQVYEYKTGQYLVISVDLPLNAHVVRASDDQPYLGFGMFLNRDIIAGLLLDAGVAPNAKAEPPGIAVSDVTIDLLDPVVRLLRLVDRPDDLPILAPAIEREIHWRLMNGKQGATVRHLGMADSRMTQVARAIKWIRGHYAETMRIDELARMAGMSVTSFHRHFRMVTSMSPLQFQKQIRLQHARSRLLSGAEDVAVVGFDVGYDSPSQFSREYKRLFGVPPGRDGQRLRSNLEPAAASI